jgi:hypothetical protein
MPDQKLAEHPLFLQRIAALETQVSWLKKQVFGGGRSEKPDRAQSHLALGVDEAREALVERTEQITCERAKIRQPRPTAAELFARLPTPETVEILPEPVKRDPDLFERIGEERAFEVDLVPACLVKREIVRPKYARPLRWLHHLATGLGKQALPQSQLAMASSYLLNHRDVLVAHREHPFTRLDNNLVENAIRPSAIRMKYWLFIGHPGDGKRSAIVCSLVVSCQPTARIHSPTCAMSCGGCRPCRTRTI